MIFNLKIHYLLQLIGFLSMTVANTLPSSNASSNKNPCGVCQCTNGHNGLNGRNGNNGSKGEKGDIGPPGPQGPAPSVGNIIFVDSSDTCHQSIAGKVRYNPSKKRLDLCDGKDWLPIAIGSGIMRSAAAKSCLEIKKTGNHHGNDLYWLDPNGGSKDDAFEAFCDMETEGGGWTLVATKVSPSFVFIKSQFSASAARNTLEDSASCIHPSMRSWTEILFRFADRSDIFVVYNRDAGGRNEAKTGFANFMMGSTYTSKPDTAGFYKSSPLEKRSPPSGFKAIVKFHYYSSSGISEDHGGTDKWLDLWNGGDSSNTYHSSDDTPAQGTKCIAGYCFVNVPVLVMIR